MDAIGCVLEVDGKVDLNSRDIKDFFHKKSYDNSSISNNY